MGRSLAQIYRAIRDYWADPKCCIFNNSSEAIWGLFPLVICPLISLLTTIIQDVTGWAGYAFPILSICIAGAYDSYSRYNHSYPAKTKLEIRIGVNLVAAVFALSLCNVKSIYLRIISPTILALSGLLIIREVVTRVKYAIQLSDWYCKKL